jgi:hypothetical protein
MNEIETMINGQDAITQAGILMAAEPLGKRKLKWQVLTFKVPFELVLNDNMGIISIVHSRVQIDTTSHKTNERIIGITLHSDFEAALNESTLQFSIDSEEIIPSGFDCSLIAAKKDVGFYKNMYRLNERANGSLLKGEYVDNCLVKDVEQWFKDHPEKETELYRDGKTSFFYEVKIYLWSIQKPLAQNNKGL